MKLAIVVVIVAILTVVYFVVVSPAMRASEDKSELQLALYAKSDIPEAANVTPPKVGEYALTQEKPGRAPLSIDVNDTEVVYAGPKGQVRFYHARTTEWGRQAIDHDGVMQSTSRALDEYAAGSLLRLDVPGHPLVRAKLKKGDWCACWMNRDNLFCAVADDKEQLTAFISAYPY